MSCFLASILLVLTPLPTEGDGDPAVVRLPLNERREAEMADMVVGLARATGVALERPKGSLKLPMAGLGGPLSRRLIASTLGPDVASAVDGQSLVLTIPPTRLGQATREDWRIRLDGLAGRIAAEEKRRESYGMGALKSYRPNDPSRPTVCLVHGLNSTSSVFLHMVEPLEAAGYGIVVYDFPYNRDLDLSAAAFNRDWAQFRKDWGETRPWAIVSHSMGGLLARSYVEDDRSYGNDVASMILIAPVNGGSNLSQAQTLLQMIQGLKAVNRGPASRGDALSHLGDGLGAAADDMAPGSAFLKGLNSHKRRSGVPYHILAGSGGFLSPAARRQIEAQLGLAGGNALLGGLTRLAASNLPAQLDEITDGTGDGCVSVASTRLDGVAEHVTLSANHLELIRAPLLYPEKGPVACMPLVLRWLEKDLPVPRPATGEAARR
jgi:pimeloyl-ACP methyl ester carboxylesterase